MDRNSLCSDVSVVPDRHGEEGAKPEGKALEISSMYVPTLMYGNELWVMTKN